MKVASSLPTGNFSKLVLCFFFFVQFHFYSQKQGNIWYFGDKAGVTFNTTPPSALTNGQTDIVLPIGWNEASSVATDSVGNLLFYSNSVLVWNKLHAVMPNGNGLLGHRSTTQGCLIVPKPASGNLYYVFTLDASENNYLNGLRYSIVDLCLDNGKGDVVAASKNTLIQNGMAEKMVGVRHANGNDYWIIVHKINSIDFYAFLLTSAGITNTVISSVGPSDGIGWGQMVASPNGQKLAYAMPTAQTQFVTAFMTDFDPSTGVVSNAQILANGGREYGAAFSPDNSKLYFSSIGVGNLMQYDLNAGNLAAIVTSKTFIFQNAPDQWRQMKLGPNGKIYYSRTSKFYLSAITSPNSLGIGCTYVDSLIYLGGKKASFGLPNFITDYKYNYLSPGSPTVTASPDVSICPGNSATLSASGASLYTWSTGATVTPLVVSPSVTSLYTVSGVFSPGSCAASASVTVFLLPAPTVPVTGNFTICSGETSVLLAAGSYTFFWSNGATGPSVSVSPLQNTTYTVTGVHRDIPCPGSTIVQVIVNDCTGIEGKELASRFLVFPNPVSELLTIQCQATSGVCIKDQLGRTVIDRQVSPADGEVDVSNLETGVYYVVLKEGAHKEVFTLIINR